MKKNVFLLWTLIFSLQGQLMSQSCFPVFNENDLEGMQFTQVRSFTDESLYGYIDGGAELYLEYGFDTLVVTELVAGGNDLKVEIYKMNDAEAAFGIFSVSRFRCNGGVKLTDYYCRSAYQLQFCKGPYYVSIINDTGSSEDQSFSNKIAFLLLERIGDDSFVPELFFPTGVTEEMMRSAVLVRGRLGIANGIPVLSDILDQAAGYTALIVRQDKSTLASVRFDSEEGMIMYLEDQQTDRERLLQGEESGMKSGASASMICIQHILIRTE